MEHATRMRFAIGAAGLAAGLLLAYVLPASWLFAEGVGGHAGHAHEPGVQYACPMFCVIMDELPADGRCPVCGMQMTKISAESRLDSHERRMAGVEVTRLGRRPLSRGVRVVGEVDYDEARLSRITTRVSGWLQKVYVDATWAPVHAGDKLAEIYAPELYAAQREYLAATGPEAGAGFAAAAEQRLRLLGIGDEEIAALKERGTVAETLVLRAPRDGVVVERQAIEGASVSTGASLYTIADLGQVWVQAEVFERDLPVVQVGDRVKLGVEGDPVERAGTVTFVDPVLDRHSRTARVRVEVENPVEADGARPLRIGQRVDVRLSSRIEDDGKEPWAVPRSAVMSTGERNVVYLLFTEAARGGATIRDWMLDPQALPDPVYYEMVPVRVGTTGRDEKGEEYVPLFGLAREVEQLPELREGLIVVTKGNLLLDSQAQLSGRPSLLFPEGNRGTRAGAHAGHAGH